MTDRNDSGFTLIEVMVGLVLLGLITAAIAGTVHTGMLGAEVVEDRAANANQIRIAQSFIRRHMETARPVRLAETNAPESAFFGARNEVRFIAVMPPWIDQGGTHLVKIAHIDGQLVFLAQKGPTNMTQLDVRRPSATTVLADAVHNAEFAYFGRQGRDPNPRWQSRWVGRPELPQLIRIRVAFVGGTRALWPELIVAPRLALAPR